jgi:hypothetical protein
VCALRQIMLAVLIALLTILTWHFTTVYTTRSIKTLAYSLRTELLNRPISRMWNLLNSTVETTMAQVQLSQFVVGQYTLPIDPVSQVSVRTITISSGINNGNLHMLNDLPVATNNSYSYKQPLVLNHPVDAITLLLSRLLVSE